MPKQKRTMLLNSFPNKKSYFKVLCFSILTCLSLNIKADGTKQLKPTTNANQVGNIMLYKGGGNQNYLPFAIYGGPEHSRLHITICDTSEKVYFGMKFRNNSANWATTTSYRIKDPSGTVVWGPFPSVPTSGNPGYITSYARAVAGPAQIVGAGTGYNALVFNPSTTGDYYIEFNYTITGNGESQRRDFEFFDITVADKDNNAKEGRVWSKNWCVSTNSFTNTFGGNFYVYSNDNLTTKLNFNGIKPYVFNIAANSTGLFNTGNPTFDRASAWVNSTNPEYRLFLTAPDTGCFPVGQLGSLTAATTINGCNSGDFCINITVDKAGQVDVLLDLNGTDGYQAGTEDVLINYNVNIGINCVPWDGLDGLGNPVQSAITVKVEVTYLNGITHIPLYDVEEHPDGFIVQPFRPAAPKVNLYWDDSTKLNAGGAFDCGSSPDVLGTINLTGCNDTITGCHPWPCNDGLNNNAGYGEAKTINTWWFVPTNNNFDSFTYIVDFISIDWNPSNPNTYDGDSTYCWSVDDSLIYLDVVVNKAAGGRFHVMPGVFSPSDSTTGGTFTGTYKPTPTEIASGEVIIKMTTYGNGDCPPFTDSITITFNDKLVINAGSDDTLCQESFPFQLNGSITNGTATASWLGGTGTFSPGRNVLNPTYTPSTAEINAGFVELVLDATSLPSGICNGTPDTVRLTIYKTPGFLVGFEPPVLEICTGDSLKIWAYNAPAGSSFLWQPGIYNSDSTNDTTYFFPPASITISLTVTSPEGCVRSISGPLTVNSLPVMDAGDNDTICVGDVAQLNGSDDGQDDNTYTWTPNTYLSNPTIINPMATPPATTVYTLTVTSGKGCQASDSATVVVNPPPIVDAGSDDTICRGDSAQLNASGAVSYTWFPPTNLTNPNIPNPKAFPTVTTSYIVTGTDANGCLNTDTVIVRVNNLPTISASGDKEICLGDTAQLMASGGTSYVWSPAVSLTNPNIPNPRAFPTSSTVYTVVGTDGNGCSNTAQHKVVVNELPNVEAGDDVEICFGDKTQLKASGARFYAWTPTATLDNPNIADPIANPATTTEYFVTGTDNKGCMNIDSVMVTVNPLPIADAGEDTAITCLATVDLLATASAGTPGYNFQWQGGPATPNWNARGAGSYTVTVTDSKGCKDNDQVVVSLTSSTLALSLDNDTAICLGESTSFTAVASGGVDPIVYTWDNGLPAIGGPHTVAPAVTTTYNVTVTDDAGCQLTDAITVTIDPLPNADAGEDVEICIGDNVQLGASGGGTYVWSPTDSLSDPNVVNPIANPTSTTKYFVTVTSAQGCQSIDSVLVTVNPLPVVDINISADSSICLNDVIQLVASGASSYVWSPATGLSNPNVPNPTASPTNSTLYFVSGTDGNGCVNMDSVVITVDPLPNVIARTDDDICIGDSIRLDATGAQSYVWSPTASLTNPNIKDPFAFPTTTTTYTVTGTDSNGCVNTDQTIITVNDLPIVEAGNDVTICLEENTQLNASGALSFVWSPDSAMSDPNVANPLVNPTASITYFVVGTDINSCQNMDSVMVTVNPLPFPNAGSNDTICIGDTALLNATGGGNYNWSPAGSLSDNSIANPMAFPASTTDYVLTVTNGFGCSDVDTVNILVHSLPLITTYGDSGMYCPNIPLQMGASGGEEYSWSPTMGLDSASFSDPMVVIDTTTTFVVMVTDSNGCSDMASLTIVISDIEANFSYNDICIGQTILFEDLSVGSINDWLWDLGNNTFTTNQNPTYDILLEGDYPITLMVTDSLGCIDSITDTVVVTDDIMVSTVPKDTAVILGESVQIHVNSQGDVCSWSPEIYLDDPNVSSPIATPLEDLTYTVVCIDSNGCRGEDTVRIIVKDDCEFFIPDAFTPNGDQENDVAYLEGFCIDEIEWKVFNRWGELVFETTDRKIGWDGSFQGKPAEVGSYATWAKITFLEKQNNVAFKTVGGEIIPDDDPNDNKIFWKGSIAIIK